MLFFMATAANAIIDVETVSVPPQIGKISESYQSTSDKVVFILRDIHDLFDAQISIEKCADFLINYHDVNMLGIEAASGKMDIEQVSNYYNSEIKKRIGKYYIKQGYIGGAELHAIVSQEAISLVGVEDRDLYKKQLKKYRDTVGDRAQVLEQLDEIEKVLIQFRRSMLPQDLQNISAGWDDYNREALSLVEYAKILVSTAEQLNFSVAEYPNMVLVQNAKVIEDKIDFSQVEAQKDALLLLLKRKIGRELDDLALLTKTQDEFREGDLSEITYYSIIHQLSQKYKIPLNEYPHFDNLLKTTQIVQKVTSIDLYNEIVYLKGELQRNIIAKSVNEEGKELINLFEALRLLQNIYSLSATEKQYTEFVQQKEKYSSSRFIFFIRQHALKHDVSFRIKPTIVMIDKMRDEIGALYELSKKRSSALAENMLQSLEDANIDHGILVAGHFHASGIEEYLRSKQISFISITPAVERVRKDIPIEERLTSGTNRLYTYFKSGTTQFKPWSALNSTEDYDAKIFESIFLVECIVEDVFMRIDTANESLNNKLFTKQVYYVTQQAAEMKVALPRCVRVLTLNEGNSHLIEVRQATNGELAQMFVVPIAEREVSYGTYGLAELDVLRSEQIAAGFFTASDRVAGILKQEYSAKEYMYEDGLIPTIEKELEKEMGEKEFTDLQTKSIPSLSADEIAKQAQAGNKEAIRNRIDSIKEILQDIENESKIEALNDLENRFLILKSQLLFYSLTPKEMKFLESAERNVNARIETVLAAIREKEEREREKQKREEEKAYIERKLKEAEIRKEKRKEIDETIESVAQLREEIMHAESIDLLYDIETKFNEMIADLTIDDLTQEDRIILNAFRIAWETRLNEFDVPQEQGKKEFSTEDLTSSELVSSEIVAKAHNYKTLVELASLPDDARFIQEEFAKLLKEIDLNTISEDERKIIDRVQEFIDKRVEILQQSGDGLHFPTLQKLIDAPLKEEESKAEQKSYEKSKEEYFTELYKLRSRALVSKSIDELKTYEERFNEIDKKMQEFTLNESQKKLLADTERIIRETLRHHIITIERKMQQERQLSERKRAIQKEKILQDLLGIKPEDKKIRLLLIENNSFERKMLENKLASQGFDVVVVEDYNVSSSFIKNQQFDVIFLDDDIIEEVTGLDFVVSLKSQELPNERTLPPIVIHTNNSVSWIHSNLKRKGITKKNQVFVVSKRDLDKNVAFLKELSMR